MRRGMKVLSIVFAVVCGLTLFAAAAQACPLCSQAIVAEDSVPKAYMYSILFMLGMPATVFTGIGTCIFLKFRKFNAEQHVGIAGDDLVTQD